MLLMRTKLSLEEFKERFICNVSQEKNIYSFMPTAINRKNAIGMISNNEFWLQVAIDTQQSIRLRTTGHDYFKATFKEDSNGILIIGGFNKHIVTLSILYFIWGVFLFSGIISLINNHNNNFFDIVFSLSFLIMPTIFMTIFINMFKSIWKLGQDKIIEFMKDIWEIEIIE